MVILTTLVLNIYIALLSFQLNGIFDTEIIRIPMLTFLVIESVFMLFLRILPKKQERHIHIPFFIICAIAFMIYICCYLIFVSLSVAKVVELTFFPICLFVTYVNFIEIESETTFDHIIDIQFYYLIVVAVAFLIAQVQRRGDFSKNVNTVYYVIFATPFILQHKNKYKKWIGLLLILSCLFFSLKRTPLIAVVLTLIFYNKNKNTIIKIFKRFILVCFMIIVVDRFFAYFMDVNMLQRFFDLIDDGGSGRIDLAKQTVDLIMNSSFFEILFGHSLISTGSVFYLGAHNDFFEVMYRMGLVGFFIFVGYFIGIIDKMNQFSKLKDYENFNLMTSTVILFFVVSFSSQLIFLPTYVGMIAIAVSFTSARNRFYLKQMQQIREKLYVAN